MPHLLRIASVTLLLLAFTGPAFAAPLGGSADHGPPAASAAPASASELHNPATDPAASLSDAQAARQVGWPVAIMAIITMVALALGTAGAKVPWLAWLARGAAATMLGAVAACGSAAYNAAVAGGSAVPIGTAVVAAALAFWQAHRPPQPALEVARAIDRATERGAIAGLLALVLSGVAVVGLAGAAASCSGAQRRAVLAGAVDCTIGVLAEHSAALRPLAKDAILAGHWDAIEAAAKVYGLEDVGCSSVAALKEIFAAPAPGVAEQSLTATPGPDKETLLAGWERTRARALGGRRFAVHGGTL